MKRQQQQQNHQHHHLQVALRADLKRYREKEDKLKL